MPGKMFDDDAMLIYAAIVLGVTLLLGVFLLLRAERRKFRRPCRKLLAASDQVRAM